MPNIVRVLLAAGAAVQMFFDVVALLANPLPMDTGIKTLVLAIALGVTLLWDIGAVVTTFIFGAHGAVYTERRRRIGTYMAMLMALLTGTALFVLLVPLGLPYLALVIIMEIFFLVVWVGDIVSSVYILR